MLITEVHRRERTKNQDPRTKKAPSEKLKYKHQFGERLLIFDLRFLIYLDLGTWFLDLWFARHHLNL